MSKESPNPEKTSKKEQSINHEATQGKKINHQVKDKREHTEPRDNLSSKIKNEKQHLNIMLKCIFLN